MSFAIYFVLFIHSDLRSVFFLILMCIMEFKMFLFLLVFPTPPFIKLTRKLIKTQLIEPHTYFSFAKINLQELFWFYIQYLCYFISCWIFL